MLTSSFNLYALWVGFATSLGLILAIGSQNAFVLRCGLRREHVFWVCIVCALSDAILIIVGINTIHWLSQIAPWLEYAVLIFGILFLFIYGGLRFRAFQNISGNSEIFLPEKVIPSLGKTLLICLALTWLNPHVYLDTLFLIGAVSLPFSQAGHAVWFGLGAIAASLGFFFALGYSATLMAPLFSSPVRWRYVELTIAVFMWLITLQLSWLLLKKLYISNIQ